MASFKVGGECDVFCTKCQLLLAHTILAMDPRRGVPARVHCNTCHTERVYRSPDGTPRPRREPSEPARPGRAGLVRESDFDRLMKNRDFSKNVRYAPSAVLALEQVVDHPTFGLGLVTAIKEGNKAEVLFKDGPKVLVFGRGAPAPG
ncbi:MAG: hypothetical protein HY904_05480 [Deltaproteobacteria bacterium]|nr:hypothetical protein [Deltaproteobacteria bacterium]